MTINSVSAVQPVSSQAVSGIRDKEQLIQELVQSKQGSSEFAVVLQKTLNEASLQDEAGAASASYDSDGLLWQQLSPMVSTAESASMAGGPSRPTDYNDLISAASQKYGVPEALIKAVIDTESSFRADAVSSAGAKGLMQLMDGTARGLGVTDSFDPAQNIDAGTRYLSHQLKAFGGEVGLALAAYNAGPTRISKLGITSDEQLMNQLHVLPQETSQYIAKVQNARSKYEV